jgi:hypothetical protein
MSTEAMDTQPPAWAAAAPDSAQLMATLVAAHDALAAALVTTAHPGATRRCECSAECMHSGYVASVTTQMPRAPHRERRTQGTLDPQKKAHLFARVDKDAKATFDSIADAAGMSLGPMLECLIEHIEFDARGLPVWWPEEAQRQEELPLKTA